MHSVNTTKTEDVFIYKSGFFLGLYNLSNRCHIISLIKMFESFWYVKKLIYCYTKGDSSTTFCKTFLFVCF